MPGHKNTARDTPAGDITLSDGGYNLTLFKHRAALGELRMETGLHHIGIAVDDLDQTVARYRKLYPRGTVIAESGDLQHGEVRIHDPEERSCGSSCSICSIRPRTCSPRSQKRCR